MYTEAQIRALSSDRKFMSDFSRWLDREMPGMSTDILRTDDPECWYIPSGAQRWEWEYEDGEIDAWSDDFETQFALASVVEWVRERIEYGEIEGGDCGEVWVSEDGEVFEDEEDAGPIWYGFPWAQSWFFQPDLSITIDQLRRCGFVVGWYDPTGKDPEDGVRLCGIDGGGYNLTDHHYIPLFLEWHKDRDVAIEIDDPSLLPEGLRALTR